MDVLRPCPFCGGEAELYEDKGGYSVDCRVCGAAVGYFGKGLPYAKGAAIGTWNQRAERTCRIVENEDGNLSCSECGASYLRMLDAWYCPDCGARIEAISDADR